MLCLANFGFHVPANCATQFGSASEDFYVAGNVASQECLAAEDDRILADAAAFAGFQAGAGCNNVTANFSVFTDEQGRASDADTTGNGAIDDHRLPGCHYIPFDSAIDGHD